MKQETHKQTIFINHGKDLVECEICEKSRLAFDFRKNESRTYVCGNQAGQTDRMVIVGFDLVKCTDMRRSILENNLASLEARKAAFANGTGNQFDRQICLVREFLEEINSRESSKIILPPADEKLKICVAAFIKENVIPENEK